MTQEQKEHWRWFASPVWHHISSMYQEHYLSSNAPHEFAGYHHKRACIYFGTAAIDAFLNEKMRARLGAQNVPEPRIYKILKDMRLGNKIEQWPKDFNTELKSLPPYVLECLCEMIAIRNEVTHPKNKDHSIYLQLDEINTFDCVRAVTEYIVHILEEMNEPYRYWLLGFNFVGLNGQYQPFENNNNQFACSLSHMGMKVPTADYGLFQAWEKEQMVGLKKFQEFYTLLHKKLPDIEPKNPFLRTPRLTKKWWDTNLISNS